MTQPKLSQTVLYEVLVSEVESLKTTKRNYDKILQETGAHLMRLEALYKEPISVNISDMRLEHARIQSTLHRGLYIPNWLGVSFLCFILGFGISVFFNYKQYVTYKHHRAYIEHADAYIEELEQQVLKNKAKR